MNSNVTLIYLGLNGYHEAKSFETVSEAREWSRNNPGLKIVNSIIASGEADAECEHLMIDEDEHYCLGCGQAMSREDDRDPEER